MTKQTKNIIAIESWDGKSVIEPRKGMKPLLTFVTSMNGTKYSYNFCYTPEELSYLLSNIPTRSSSLLYLSLHGSPEKIKLGMFSEFEIGLDNLAEMMGSRFVGFGIHFGSCATLFSWEETMRNFMNKTGVVFCSGYEKYVDFNESSIMDLAFINRWIYARNHKRMFENMKKSYKQLMKDNGFSYFIS